MTFQKGKSGNAAGRPKGQTPGAQIRNAIEARSEDILKAVIDAAVGGDMAACKMLLDRITPSLKNVAPQINISVPKSGGLSEKAEAIISSAFTGSIPPDTASQLLAALSAQSKIIEVDELAKRVKALEEKA